MRPPHRGHCIGSAWLAPLCPTEDSATLRLPGHLNDGLDGLFAMISRHGFVAFG